MPMTYDVGETRIPKPESIAIGPMEIRPAEYQVFIDGERLHLTVREFQMLWTLARNADRVLPRGTIYEEMWGMPMRYRDRAVDTFVRNVRLKLTAAAPEWTFIHTHFGIGYRFAPERAVPE